MLAAVTVTFLPLGVTLAQTMMTLAPLLIRRRIMTAVTRLLVLFVLQPFCCCSVRESRAMELTSKEFSAAGFALITRQF